MTFLNQKTNKQKVLTELRANIRQEVEGKKSSKTFFKVLERQNLQNQTIFDDNKSKKILAILRTFAKNIMKIFTPR